VGVVAAGALQWFYAWAAPCGHVSSPTIASALLATMTSLNGRLRARFQRRPVHGGNIGLCHATKRVGPSGRPLAWHSERCCDCCRGINCSRRLPAASKRVGVDSLAAINVAMLVAVITGAYRLPVSLTWTWSFEDQQSSDPVPRLANPVADGRTNSSPPAASCEMNLV